MYKFKATIFKGGINALVDIPLEVTDRLQSGKGYIWIRGEINCFPFTANLVPTKNGPYRLYVNMAMLEGGNASVGDNAGFAVERNDEKEVTSYPMPKLLIDALKKERLGKDFRALSNARQKDILKYLHYLKTEVAVQRNIDKLVGKLQREEKDVRIP